MRKKTGAILSLKIDRISLHIGPETKNVYGHICNIFNKTGSFAVTVSVLGCNLLVKLVQSSKNVWQAKFTKVVIKK